ncbi:MAG: MBL fold metallo-hydrolase [Desulfobulbaceae bacterium]|nr:MBL fold metallo-hydrolase [Desulfobulbaceae bacterium]
MIQITDGVYSYLDVHDPLPTNSFGANSGIIIGDEGVAVIDSLGSAKEAQNFLAEIKTITDKPIQYLILTHHHLNHSFGASVFKNEGAEIVAHADCLDEMVKHSHTTLENATSYGLTAEELAGTEIVYPTRTFNGQSLKLDFKGVDIRLVTATPSHSRGSLFVHLPEKKVVFTGDLLFTDYHPYMGEGQIVRWRAELDKVSSLGAEKIIPGHGPLSSNRDLMEMKSYLAQFDTLATEIVSHGKNIDRAYRELYTTLPTRSRSESLIMANLRIKYFHPTDQKAQNTDNAKTLPAQ